MNFTQYLEAKKLSLRTVQHYTKYIQQFLTWLKEEDIRQEDFTYSDLLTFMQYCNEKGITKRTLHNLLCMIRHYCNYLISEKKRNDNPATGVFIKGLIRKLPSHLLSIEEMEELYQQYSIQLSVDASKKIMLGLMIYQGLTVAEILRLQHHHIKLKDGKIFIPGTKRTNERVLNLHAVQITILQTYLTKNKFKEGAVFKEQIKKPISKKNINNRIQYMFSQLRSLHPKVINAKHIRSSVITEWLRKNNLRQVQYMAGHKYVSSTQRYQLNYLDDLQNELRSHHPMK
jgi:site-specific recombinase XerD